MVDIQVGHGYGPPMNEMSVSDSLISAPQAAELLRCSLRTVERLQADGLLHPTYVHSGVRRTVRRYERDEVLALRDNAEQAS